MKDRAPILLAEPTPPPITQVYCKTCPIANRWPNQPCRLRNTTAAEKANNTYTTPGTTQADCGGMEVREEVLRETPKAW